MSDLGQPALELRGVQRIYPGPDGGVEVLRGVDLILRPGEIVALVGPSGAGKSTLLHLAGLLEPPDAGEVLVQGEATAKLNDSKRTALRRGAIGFVYQFHQLMPEFSALENVVLPQMIAGISKKQASARARMLLERVGIGHRADHRPGKLSGGEQQRCAIARGLANAPRVLLADEPTGNLDPETAERVFAELTRLAREDGVAALIATHNLELAHRMDRTVRLAGGKLAA